MVQPLISVIVPVYKVEKYLDQCVRSIVNQTYRNLEIILVDDGSPDRCPAMCDEWAKRDRRIRVIHQKNMGGGEARNVAMDVAVGEYIAFVDSDDYISPMLYEIMMEKFQDGVDVVECHYTITTSNQTAFSLQRDGEVRYYDVEQAMELHIRNAGFSQIIWNKVFRKGVIGGIRFPVQSKIDDEFWTYQVLGNARKLAKIDSVLYAYRQQEDSVMHTIQSVDRLRAVDARYRRHVYMCKHFPRLRWMSASNVCGFLLYTGQRFRSDPCIKGHRDTWRYLKNVLEEIIPDTRGGKMKLSQKIWMFLAKWNLKGVCTARNLLHFGQ